MRAGHIVAAVLLAGGLLGAAVAQNGERHSEEQLIIPLSPLAPGPDGPVEEKSPTAAQFKDSPEMIAAGRQLYLAMNCVGCHANGGGGMGPALMDDTWIYGSSLTHIFASIREGRPNGMPSFRGRVPDEQIWQIAAYVQSLSKGNDQANAE